MESRRITDVPKPSLGRKAALGRLPWEVRVRLGNPTTSVCQRFLRCMGPCWLSQSGKSWHCVKTDPVRSASAACNRPGSVVADSMCGADVANDVLHARKPLCQQLSNPMSTKSVVGFHLQGAANNCTMRA